jgi:hypothetical protein
MRRTTDEPAANPWGLAHRPSCWSQVWHKHQGYGRCSCGGWQCFLWWPLVRSLLVVVGTVALSWFLWTEPASPAGDRAFAVLVVSLFGAALLLCQDDL